MNTVQLSERLGRHLAVEDPANLPADAALDVLTAINAGISCYYRELPGIYRQTTISQTLRAPVEGVGIVFAGKYSCAVAADTFSVIQRGCTVRFTSPAGARDNEITGSDSMLDEWLEDDLNAVGNVYSDTMPIEYVIKRIISEVRLYRKNSSDWCSLTLTDKLRRWPVGAVPMFPRDYYYSFFGIYGPSAVGQPRHYLVEPVGASQGGDPPFYLRVGPLPDTDYTVRFEAELGPRKITFAELNTAVRVPVAEDYAEELLLPLCEAELVSSRFWRDANAKAAITAKAEAVRREKLGTVPAVVTRPRNSVGTPRGY